MGVHPVSRPPRAGLSSYEPAICAEKTYSLPRKIALGAVLISVNLLTLGMINVINKVRREFRRVFLNEAFSVQAKGYPGVKELIFMPESERHSVDIAALNSRNFPPISKISCTAKNARAFGYWSEGVKDWDRKGWGCAWRAIQTMLSTFGDVPGFFDLYTRYGSREFLERQFKEAYPERHAGNLLMSWKRAGPNLLSAI